MSPAFLLYATWFVMLSGFIVASDPLRTALAWIASLALILTVGLCLGRKI